MSWHNIARNVGRWKRLKYQGHPDRVISELLFLGHCVFLKKRYETIPELFKINGLWFWHVVAEGEGYVID
jgi:hypothetical protein